MKGVGDSRSADPPGASRWSRMRRDGLAGLINAVVSVPDGLASAALAGVNPVYGLYTSMAAALGAAPLLSTQLMQVATTSASALAAGQAIAAYPEAERDDALFLIVLITGAFLVAFGLLRLGRLVRFVSHAVMNGFLIGVAVVLIVDQLAPLVGFTPPDGNEVTQFVALTRNVPRFHLQTIVIGVLAFALLVAVARTRLAQLSSLVALVVPAAAVALLGWSDVRVVGDVSPISRGIPRPVVPDLSLASFDLVLAAFALAVIIAVQGAGVSQTVDNPDGTRGNASRDLLAQGAGNLLSGLLRGIPAGGSVGQTALNVNVGARTRWASFFSGLWMLAFLVLIPGLVSLVPMAVLAALMIMAGLSAIDLREARSIWMTSAAARWSILVTFVATLFLSVPTAVGVGVILTIVIYIASSASDVRVRQLIPLEDGRFAEADPPEKPESDAVTILDVYGSLFFAGARTLEEALPNPAGTQRPVVILRMRGRTSVGATLVDVLDEYEERLQKVGGRLYLSGVGADVAEQLRSAGKLDLDNAVEMAADVVGESTARAVASATAWLGNKAR